MDIFSTLNLSSAIDEYTPANIASASTVNIGAAKGNYLNITGTTTITAFDTIKSGVERVLKFADALTLTHNATSLQLISETNILTTAGDVAVFRSLGSGNWKCTAYVRQDGSSIKGVASDAQHAVLSGPLDGTSHLPNFLPATATGLNLTSQNINTGLARLVVCALNGYDARGITFRIGSTAANITWSSLTNNTTNYLFVDVNADGTLTPVSSTIAPAYVVNSGASTTSGAYTYRTKRRQAVLGNGSTTDQVYRVPVGEAVTSGGNVTSTVAYEYRLTRQNDKITNLSMLIGDRVNVIPTGLKHGFRVPFDCYIIGVYLGADASGSIVLDIWKDSTYPPTVADTITASAKPTISSATNSSDTTLIGWIKMIYAGDWVFFNVDSVSTLKFVSANLVVVKA